MSSEKMPKISSLPIGKYPKIDNVYGKAREFIDDLIDNIEGRSMFNVFGIEPNKTFLLAGEKGTGKTMSIHAINNTLNKHILNIMDSGEVDEDFELSYEHFKLLTFSYDIGSYGTAYINMSSRRVQSFFDTVGTYAQIGKPTLVMLDEADALLLNRKGNVHTHSEDKKTLETIMKNLQWAHDTPNLYTVLVTNLPEGCDEASLRAGRIDEKYMFELPDKDERRFAFQQKISEAQKRAGYNIIRAIDYDNLVNFSQGFNYADIVASIDKSIRERATELIRDTDTTLKRAPYISGKRLEKKIKEHKKNFVEERVNKIGYKVK